MVETSAVTVVKKSNRVGKTHDDTQDFDLLPKNFNLDYLELKAIRFMDTDYCK